MAMYRYLGRLNKYKLITDEWRCFKSLVKFSYLGSRGLESGDQTLNSKFLTALHLAVTLCQALYFMGLEFFDKPESNT